MEPKILDKITRAILDGMDEPATAPVAEMPLPEVYYDGASFYIQNTSGGWVRVDRRSVREFLVSQGYNSRRADDQPQSQVDGLIVRIQREHDVIYVAPLAGHKAGLYTVNGARILVTNSPRFVEPMPGSFPILSKFLESALGTEQRLFFQGWMKVALEMYRSGRWQPGQLLALCGEVGGGKNLLRHLITEMLGGRVAFPHAFMTGRTTFSSDMFEAETLAIEDQQESTDFRARRNFGAAIKNVTVNQDQRCERKHRDPLTLRPLWRIIVSLNDDPERMQVLPPLDDDIQDKIMLLEVYKKPLPMPTQLPAEWEAFRQTLSSELPMFVHFLNEWKIPTEIQSDRFGVCQYHNPRLADELGKLAPELCLLEMIERALFDETNETWEGTAAQLEDLLTAEGSKCGTQARKLLKHPNSCGTYLGRLERKYSDLVSRTVHHGTTVWKLTWRWAGRAEAERSERKQARAKSSSAPFRNRRRG